MATKKQKKPTGKSSGEKGGRKVRKVASASTQRRKKQEVSHTHTGTVIRFCIYIVLILAAAGAGLYLAGVLKEDVPAHRNFVVKEKIMQDGLSENDRELIYVLNPEGDAIESLIVSELDAKNGELSYYLLDNQIGYTMTGTLFSTLTVTNIRLPQTVILGNLCSYYGSDDFLDAGRRIIEEMLGAEIKSYIVFTAEELADYIYVGGRNHDRLKPGSTLSELKEKYTDTVGSLLGAIKAFSEGRKSNRSAQDRIRYLEVLDGLDDEDVFLETVPTQEHNETVSLDYSGWNELAFSDR